MTEKKGQEEIIGLVLIMIVVAVVAVIFLGISIRSESQGSKTESSEIYQFLESSMRFTSACDFSSSPSYYAIEDLFEECYLGKECLNGESVCEALESEFSEILGNSWNVDPDGKIKGYVFRSEYVLDSGSSGDNIILIEEGECVGAVRGASYLIPAFPGKIESQLSICS